MQIEVKLSLEVDTDLESVEDVVGHVVFDELMENYDDVVAVTNVKVVNFSKV